MEIIMAFKDIKNALEDLFDGTPEIWRDLCADDIHFESIHGSHSGNSFKTKDEMYAMHQELGAPGGADVRCLIETDSVISVTHASPRSLCERISYRRRQSESVLLRENESITSSDYPRPRFGGFFYHHQIFILNDYIRPCVEIYSLVNAGTEKLYLNIRR